MKLFLKGKIYGTKKNIEEMFKKMKKHWIVVTTSQYLDSNKDMQEELPMYVFYQLMYKPGKERSNPLGDSGREE